MISERTLASILKQPKMRRIIHVPLVQRLLHRKRIKRIWRENNQIDTNKWVLPKNLVLRFDNYKKRLIRQHFANHQIQVTSFGGAGTTMLCKFIDHEGAGMPADYGDWRPWKHMYFPPLDSAVSDSFRAIYIYSDPREALLSVFRRGYQHWHIQRMDGEVESWDFNCNLAQFLELNRDTFHYHRHFQHWTQAKRKYPILFIHYDELWNRLPEIIEFAGLPASAIERFPQRKMRNTNLDNVDPEVLAMVNHLFADLLADMDRHPKFKILEPAVQS